MQIVTSIDDNIVKMIEENDKIGRQELANLAGIPVSEARYILKIYKSRDSDTSPKTLGMNHILRERLNKQARYIKKLEGELAAEQMVLDALADLVVPIPKPKIPPKIDLKEGKKIDVRDAVTIWSDWHGSEVVDPDQVEGRNEYNSEIMLGRAWDLVRGLARIVNTQRVYFDIQNLYIDLLGDFVAGNIHDELRESNDLPVLQSASNTAFLLAQAIATLTPHFERIIVTGLPGNHGRLYKKYEYKNRVLNNFDTMIYQLTSLWLANFIIDGKIEFNIPQSPECVMVRSGWAFLLGHSDHIRGWSGVPWYGFQRDDAKQQKLRKGRSVVTPETIEQAESLEGAILNMKTARNVYGYDYRECGHWHQMDVIDDWSTIINGCLVGTDEYSLNKLHALSTPKQSLFFISERWGIKGVEPIHCTYRKDHKFQQLNGVAGYTIDNIDLLSKETFDNGD